MTQAQAIENLICRGKMMINWRHNEINRVLSKKPRHTFRFLIREIFRLLSFRLFKCGITELRFKGFREGAILLRRSEIGQLVDELTVLETLKKGGNRES